MRALIGAAVLALAGCASMLPKPASVAPSVSTPTVEINHLRGEVASLVYEGKLSGSDAIALNKSLQLAQFDISVGDVASAQKIIKSVEGKLP